MRLDEYIRVMDGTLKAFADRTGLPISTIDRIARGQARCRIDVAEKIVRASHNRPTPSGGVVTFEELVPAESAA